jgi:flagellar basal body-associated protein FliL
MMHNVATGTFVQADNRIPLHLFGESPEVPWLQPQDIEELKRLFQLHDKTLFARLVGGSAGGKTIRQYTPELHKVSEVYQLVLKCITPYLMHVQDRYPALTHFKLSALKTSPNAVSQYSRCNWKLHSDYDESVNSRPPNERPVSLMVAIDQFEFMYLKNRTDSRRDIINLPVHRGQAIAFTNYCLHAGGANNTPNVCYRLFAYMVSNKADIPIANVYQYPWIGAGDPQDNVIHTNLVLCGEYETEPRVVPTDKSPFKKQAEKNKKKNKKKKVRTCMRLVVLPILSIFGILTFIFFPFHHTNKSTEVVFETSVMTSDLDADAVSDPPLASTPDDTVTEPRIPSEAVCVKKLVPSAADSTPDDIGTEPQIPSEAVSVAKLVSIIIIFTMTHPTLFMIVTIIHSFLLFFHATTEAPTRVHASNEHSRVYEETPSSTH